MTHTNVIIVQETEDAGEFRVVRGGDIYRKWGGNFRPDTVKAGDGVSAAEICEWVEAGTEVQDSPLPSRQIAARRAAA